MNDLDPVLLRKIFVQKLKEDPVRAWQMIATYVHDRNVSRICYWADDIEHAQPPHVVVMVIEEALPRLYRMTTGQREEIKSSLNDEVIAFFGIHQELFA
jgi:hypothetical protein